MLRGGVTLTLAFALIATAASPASAQRDHDELARVHFQSGSAYFEIGDYEAAVREFEAAYRVSPRDLLLFNLYLAHERLGNLEEAFGYLERYLAADPDIPQQEKNTLALRLENMRARLATRDPGEPAPVAPPPEPVVVVVPVPTPAPAPVAEPPVEEASVDEAPAQEPPAERSPNIGGITSFAVAGAGFTVMITAGAMAWKQDRELNETCGDPASTTPCSDEDRERLSTLTKTADIGLLITGVGVIAGVLFYVLDRDDESDDDDGADLAISPWFGLRAGGLAAQGSF